jgi:LPXTG-motif cell wall-anchored protein
MKKLLFLLTVMLIAIGISVAQSTGNDQSSSSTSGNAASSSSSTSPQGATGTSSDQATQGNAASDQTGQGANTSDQGTAGANTGASGRGAKGGNLPQTASPLPLLGLLGMGSLAAGVLTRRKNR